MKLVVEVTTNKDETLAQAVSRAGEMVNALMQGVPHYNTIDWFVERGAVAQPDNKDYTIITEYAAADPQTKHEEVFEDAAVFKGTKVGGRIVIMQARFDDESMLANVQGKLVGLKTR